MSNATPANNLAKLAGFISRNFKGLKPRYIVELGARDCIETIAMHNLYPQAQILSFECNPAKIEECRARVKGVKEIILIEKAVSDKAGNVSFFQIDAEKTVTPWQDGNPGASSLFKASGNYQLETYVQKEVTVPCTTLAQELPIHNFSAIDLLWMDIQGSELNALKGLGEKLQSVSIIHTEVEFMEIYVGQPMFWEVKKFLNSQGFLLAAFTTFHKNAAGDAVFVNSNKLTALQKLKYMLTNRTLHLLYHYKILSV